MLFKNDKGKIVGELSDGVYRKKVSGKKHLLRLMDAWGIDEAIFKTLQGQDCTSIRILDTDDSVVYATTPENFKAHSVVRNFDGEQRFMSRKFFEKYPQVTH